MSSKQLRLTMRWVHILVAVAMGIYLYSPLGDDATYTALIQAVVFPVLGVSGVVMWQQGRIVKWWRQVNP